MSSSRALCCLLSLKKQNMTSIAKETIYYYLPPFLATKVAILG